jgi:hypothetical protein
MKYNMASLDLALDTVLPKIALAKRAGIDFDRPCLIKNAAYKCFVDNSHKLDTHLSMCYHVIRQAAKDLDDHGYFQFGELEIVLV